MKRLKSTKGMSKEEWLMCRKKGVGGSDAGAICGLNPYASAITVYQDKVEESISDWDNESMRQGRDLEEYVARRFMEATGKKVRNTNYMYCHDQYSFLTANVDRMIVGENAGLECKTANAYQFDKWENGKIPPHYELQCHHYMMVTGMKAWYIAVAILGREFKYYKIERDEGLIQDLLKIETNFWNNHVIPRIMPQPDGSKVCDEIINEYFPKARHETKVLTSEFESKLQRREELVKIMNQIEGEKKQIEQEVKLYLGEVEEAENSKFRVKWSNVETNRLDTKRLQEECPDIYSRFIRRINSRRFMIKAA